MRLSETTALAAVGFLFVGSLVLVGNVGPRAVDDPGPATHRRACGGGGRPTVVVNEVLYDPAGKDAGSEYVELFNPSGAPICLEGWRIESGNGSYEDRWRCEWTGSSVDTIVGRSFFVVGEELVLPPPDVTADLDLQNGPDACRVCAPDGSGDVVGWGEHVYGEYYEGEPAANAAAGRSIGRVPDGLDSDRNNEDFRTLDLPTPGDFNQPPCDLAIEAAALSGYCPPDAPAIDLVCRVLNVGTESCGSGARVFARVASSTDSGDVGPDLAPGTNRKVVLRLAHPGEGIHVASVWARTSCDRWHANDTLVATIVLPPPPLVINEIMFQPAAGQCEWVEIHNRSAAALDIAGWTMEDSGRRPRTISDAECVVAPAGFAVLVEQEGVIDTEDSCQMVLRPKGGWPALNDVDGPLGFADAVVLRNSLGTTIDSVAYRAAWAAPGNSVERVDPAGPSAESSNWSPHFGPSTGSPGGPNSVSFHLPQTRNLLDAQPPVFSPNGDGTDDLLAISVALARASAVTLRVFDVNGRAVRSLIDTDSVESRRVVFWDGTDDRGSRVRSGVYVIRLQAVEEPVGERRGAKCAVVLKWR